MGEAVTKPATDLCPRISGGTKDGDPQDIELEFRYEGKKALLRIEAAYPRFGLDSERVVFAQEVRKAAEALLAAGPPPTALSRSRRPSAPHCISSDLPGPACGRCNGTGVRGRGQLMCPDCGGTGI